MYYLKELNHSLKLHPAFFTANLKDHLKKRLLAEVEGSCSGRYGYIVCVLKIIKIDKGIINLDGHAEYQIKYQCIVSKPFKGEVVEGIVNSVNKMGFFCEVGPLNVFISTHLIDNSFAFDPNGNPPCFTDGTSDLKIQKGASIRLKLVGIKADAAQIFAIGSIKEDYLGILPFHMLTLLHLVVADYCSPGNKVCVQMTTDKQNLNVTMNLKVSSSVGWAAIGTGNSMTNSDMIIVWKSGNQIISSTRYSTTEEPPTVFKSKSLYVPKFAVAGDSWTVTVVRPLKPTSDGFKNAIVKGSNNFVYAYSTTAPSGSNPSADIKIHTSKGTFEHKIDAAAGQVGSAAYSAPYLVQFLASYIIL